MLLQAIPFQGSPNPTMWRKIQDVNFRAPAARECVEMRGSGTGGASDIYIGSLGVDISCFSNCEIEQQ